MTEHVAFPPFPRRIAMHACSAQCGRQASYPVGYCCTLCPQAIGNTESVPTLPPCARRKTVVAQLLWDMIRTATLATLRKAKLMVPLVQRNTSSPTYTRKLLRGSVECRHATGPLALDCVMPPRRRPRPSCQLQGCIP